MAGRRRDTTVLVARIVGGRPYRRRGGPPGPSRTERENGASAPEQQSQLLFKRRDSVQHAKFGVGTVIESNLVDGEEEVTVAFPGIGIKRSWRPRSPG